ncbi:dTDP-4-dehydrorhamnose 3,5-epimerase [Pseudaminobacter soli (ex Li et al. 2025)]|uniref:dTDP-4-dehydrorhamnose 3,5-epimerase n=1 Tax=Pseudaminobacter soli (ex Li et al. 2025) TaxID=1295366 RepID=A0A2P7S0V6_9HYPH|nr:dTDP-4-dehydrorhamnose 3,5-epimerase [Mesorhizobium soli]PSJ56104.1 dTDP-4-dehydrorhamnose 3,5-epimerase [Mesorhizobium soli]
MVDVLSLGLDGVFEIRPPKFVDARGFFSETWNAAKLAKAGISVDFVQDNHSFSRMRGVMRGLHFQMPPFAQDKLVRVLRGSVFDVAVDIRRGSPTFGKWTAVTLSARQWNQILVPKGFAHGFVTLEPDTEVVYKVSAPYSAPHERSIRSDDPDIAIDWPVPATDMVLSPKDEAAPFLADLETGFNYR